MGGAASRFGETDWDLADGGLKDASETLDGAKPTKRHSILTLTKHNMVNQREYDVKDDLEELLYTTEAVEGTVKWFDLLSKEGERLFRVQADSDRTNWDVFAFGKPSFEGQEPDGEATKKASEPLYRKARVIITWDKHHGHVALYKANEMEDVAGVLQKDEPILKVEEIRSITAQYQSYVPKVFNMGIPHPPLAGHWVWENTVAVHKMKMHLAKGTDTALHVILAVLTNMVRTERETAGLARDV